MCLKRIYRAWVINYIPKNTTMRTYTSMAYVLGQRVNNLIKICSCVLSWYANVNGIFVTNMISACSYFQLAYITGAVMHYASSIRYNMSGNTHNSADKCTAWPGDCLCTGDNDMKRRAWCFMMTLQHGNALRALCEGINRPPVYPLTMGQECEPLMISLMLAWRSYSANSHLRGHGGLVTSL